MAYPGRGESLWPAFDARRRQQQDAVPEDQESFLTASFLKSHGKYGFIKQASGDDMMFVRPKACVGFYGQFPEPGTGLSYSIVLDERTGHPRAEDVNPLAEASFSPASRRPPQNAFIGTPSLLAHPAVLT